MNHSTESTGEPDHLSSGRSLAGFHYFAAPAERTQSRQFYTRAFPALLANLPDLLHTDRELGCSCTCMPTSTKISQDTGQL